VWLRDLRKVYGENQQGNLFNSNLRWKIGNGNKARLSDDT